MFTIALQMLFRDRTRYLLLVSVLALSSLLITQQGSVFCGLMRWTTSSLRNSKASIWVVDPRVNQLNEVKALRDTDLARVRSTQGVAWAVPLHWSIAQARLEDGRFKSVQIVGVDTATLIGLPPVIIVGNVEDLWQDKAVMIDTTAVDKLSEGRKKPLGIGDTFEIEDVEAKIVAICKAEKSFFGYPYVFTTFDRIPSYVKKTRKILSFILAEPREGWTVEDAARQVEKETQLKAYTEEEFFWSTIWWYVKNTGIPISFGTTVLLGFIVGWGVAGQTFYSFVMENLPSIGALKAMGLSNRKLYKMVLLQALSVGLIGYGIGVGLAALFGYSVVEKGTPPFFMPYQLLIFTFCVELFICLTAAFFAVWRIRKIDPAVVFRG